MIFFRPDTRDVSCRFLQMDYFVAYFMILNMRGRYLFGLLANKHLFHVSVPKHRATFYLSGKEQWRKQ